MKDLSPVYSAIGSVLKEQREEIDHQILDLSSTIAGLAEKAAAIEVAVGTRDTALHGALEAARRDIEALRAEVLTLPAPLDFSGDIAALKAAHAASVEHLQKGLAEVDGTAQFLQRQVSEMAGVEPAIAVVAAGLDHLREKQADHTGALAAADGHVAKLSASLLTLESETSETKAQLQGEIAQWVEQVENLTGRLEDLPAPPPDRLEHIGVVETKVAEVEGYVVHLSAVVGTLRDDVLATVTEASTSIKGLAERVERLPVPPPDRLPEIEKVAGDVALKIASMVTDLGEITAAVLQLQEQGALVADVDAVQEQIVHLEDQLKQAREESAAEQAVSAKTIDFSIRMLQDQVRDIRLMPGPAGASGARGPQGEKGLQGVCGERGVDGPQGVAGVPGRDGIGLSAKIWEPGIFREGELVQYGFGKLAKAVRDTTAPPESRVDWERIGTSGFELKGVKQEDAQYEQGDIFVDGGSCFVHWNGKARMLVKRGRDGKNGEPGADGRDGRNGRDGSDGPKPLELRAYAGGMALVYDDGEIVEFPVDGLKAYMDDWYATRQDEVEGTPILAFQGLWQQTEAYSRGDIVSYSSSLHLCLRPTPAGSPLSEEYWTRLVGSSALGGFYGGGSAIGSGNFVTAEDQRVFGLLPGVPETTIAFDDTTYAFTISPVAAEWTYYREGVRCTVAGAKSVTLPGEPPTAGIWWISIDDEIGTLDASLVPWSLGADSTVVPVAFVEWNAASAPKFFLYDERHPADISRGEHAYLHNTRGAQYASGGGISGYTLQDGTATASNTFGVSAGAFYDETLRNDVPALLDPNGTTLSYSIRWRNGAGGWTWSKSEVPYPYAAGSYIQVDNASGTLSNVNATNRYLNSWLLMTSAGWQIIAPQVNHATLAAAAAETFDTLSLAGFNAAEYVAVQKLTWRTGSAYAALGKVRLEAVTRISASAIPGSSQQLTATNVSVAATPTNYTPSAPNVEAHLDAINTALAPAEDVQVFTGNGTWAKPTGRQTKIEVFLVGAGGGGGSGRVGAASSNANGGTGGAGGSAVLTVFNLSAFGGTVPVTVGTGGSGGAAITTDATNGAAGSPGGESTFGSIVAPGGSGGFGGTNSSTGVIGPGGSVGYPAVSSSGATANVTLAGGVTPTASPLGGGGGGSGTGLNTSNAQRAGCAGAAGSPGYVAALIAGGILGTSNNAGDAGDPASDASAVELKATGAGGGGGGGTITANSGAGGAGGYPGGGGGGSGAARDTYDTGAGGRGANGYVRIRCW